jgi:tetratricopeptide (TPR) repeat protein
MRRVLLAILVLSLPGWSDYAQASEPAQGKLDFKAANDRLLKGDAEGALALYEHLIVKGVVHPDLYYNLGNTYAALNRPVDAIIAYERSLLRDPGAESTQHNLAQLRKNIDPSYEQVTSQVLPAEPLDTIRSLIGALDPNVFAWLLLLANAGFFSCLGFLRYSRKPSLRRYAVIVIGASMVCLVFTGTITVGHYILAQDKLAVITEASPIKTGPHQRFEASDQAHIGSRVRILDAQGDWTEVKTRLGTTGWVPKSKLTTL